jgi:hypothetical protein
MKNALRRLVRQFNPWTARFFLLQWLLLGHSAGGSGSEAVIYAKWRRSARSGRRVGQQKNGADAVRAFTETYSVTLDSPTALFLNIRLDYPDFGLFHGEASLTGLYSGTSTITYSITGSGAATLVKIQTTINGTTVTFQ